MATFTIAGTGQTFNASSGSGTLADPFVIAVTTDSPTGGFPAFGTGMVFGCTGGNGTDSNGFVISDANNPITPSVSGADLGYTGVSPIVVNNSIGQISIQPVVVSKSWTGGSYAITTSPNGMNNNINDGLVLNGIGYWLVAGNARIDYNSVVGTPTLTLTLVDTANSVTLVSWTTDVVSLGATTNGTALNIPFVFVYNSSAGDEGLQLQANYSGTLTSGTIKAPQGFLNAVLLGTA